MADEDDPASEAAHEALEPVEAVQVEVVRRLVEQHDVEPREQQGGEADAGGLPAGQRGHQRLRPDAVLVGADGQAEVGEHDGDAVVEVGCTRREPAVERRRVGVRSGVPGAGIAERGSGGVHRRGRLGAAVRRAMYAATVSPGDAFVLLRQEADERVGRRERHTAGERFVHPGEQAQQGGLAGAVQPRRRR